MVCRFVLLLEHGESVRAAQPATQGNFVEKCLCEEGKMSGKAVLPVAVPHGQDAPVPEDSAHGSQIPRPKTAQQAKHGR